MATQDKPAAVEIEDLYEMVEDDLQREIHNGELIIMAPSGDEATEVGANSVRLLGNFVISNKLGRVTGADGGFILSTDPKVTYAPDAGFISKERATPHTGKFYNLAPDLAVEVVSPSDSAQYVQEKIQNYLRYGTKQVWVMYPKTRVVEIHSADSVKKLKQDDVIDGGDVLPGFSLPVQDVFAVLEEA